MTSKKLPMPQTGGAYIRGKDGELIPEPTATGEASPSPPTPKKDKR